MRDSYGLGDGDPDIEQIAGMYKDIKGSTINGEVGEAHHIIPQSLVENDKKYGTSIELEKQDHRDLPTTGGIINRTYESFLPDSPKDGMSYRDEITSLMGKGLHAEAFKNEILDIMKNEYDKTGNTGKYDGAIRAAIDTEIDFIEKNGVPKARK